MVASEIYVLADAITGTGEQTGVVTEFKGNFGGLIYIDFDGTSFTATLQARAASGDTWLTMATIDETTTAVQEVIIGAEMRLNCTAFTGTTLTVKISA